MGSRYDVFLCHNQADKPAVQELAERLRALGLNPWIDEADLRRGVQWTAEVEKCLVEESASCAVMIGPSGLGPWQKRELDSALDRQVEASRTNGSFPVIPVLLPGGKLEALPGFLKGHTCVSFAKVVDDANAIDELARAIRGLLPLRSQPAGGECPYRGLEFFDVAHAPYFYGREELTARLLEKIGANGQTKGPSRFLAIVGASGSGKSSLARAGLVAALQRGAIDGSDQWPVVICRPGADPCANLAVELARSGSLGPDKLAAVGLLKERMLNDPQALHEGVQLNLPSSDPSRRLVVLVDQFEELFTICPDQKLRTAFVANLLYAAQVPLGQTLVLLAMRADFYGKCAADVDLANALSERQQLIGPMTPDELAAAIEKPAQKVGCELEPGLVDLLLKDVVNDPGSLPYLQFALRELWNKRTGRRLSTEVYREIGGVTGALQRKADEVYAGLSPAQQQICRRIFLRLTQPGEGTEDTKRRVPLRELEPQGGSMAEVETVLSNLSQAESRLVTGEAENGEEFVEVAHEALIRGWPQLRTWIDADRTALLTHRRLTEAARQWTENKREASFLYSGARLATVSEWATKHADELDRTESDFLQSSRRHSRAQRLKIGSIVALLLLAGFAGITWKWREANGNAVDAASARDDAKREAARAEKARDVATIEAARAATARGDAEAEKRRADEDARTADTAKIVAERRLAETYLDRGLRLCEEGEAARGALCFARALESLPSRRATVAAGRSNSDRGDAVPDPEHAIRANLGAWVESINSLKTILESQRGVKAVAYSPGGKTVLTGSGDFLDERGEARLWDAVTGQPIGAPLQHEGSVVAVAYSPDGKTVLTGSRDKTARLWDASTGKPIGVPLQHQGAVVAVAYSPDGKTVLTGSRDNTARLWDASTGKPIGAPLQHQGSVVAVAYSPDGKTVLTGSGDNTARLWDASTGKPTEVPLQHQGSVVAVAYSPDGKTVLTGSGDNTARLWDASTGKPIGVPLQHQSSVVAVAYGPDGKTVLTGSWDKTARLWDASTGKPTGVPLQHQGSVVAVAYSPDGKTVLTGSWDKTTRLWDASTGKPIGAPLQHQGSVVAVAYSPDGKTVLTGSGDNTARLWDASTGKPIGVPFQHQGSVFAVAYSADGKAVLTGSGDKTARLWDASTGKPIGVPFQHQGSVFAVAYSADGKTVLTGSGDKTARLWDASTGKPIGVPLQHQGSVFAVAYSPDGKTVLTGSGGNTARLWDASTGKPIGAPLQHQGSVVAVAYSPDGKTVLTGSRDKTARLWDASTGKPIGAPLQHQGYVVAVVYSPDGKTVLTGSGDNTARLWDASTGKPIGVPLQHQSVVFAVAYSPDGKTVLTGSGDNTARLWDASTGKPIGVPLQHQGCVVAVAYSPDGKTVLTGSEDNTARLWDAATGKPIGAPLVHHGYVNAVAYSSDGKMVLTGSADKTARLWPSPVPVLDDPPRVSGSIRCLTGMEFDEGDAIHLLRSTDWLALKRRLDSLGGPSFKPIAPLGWHRAQANESEFKWQWFAASFHLKYVIDANPSDARLRLRRSDALAEQDRWREAAAELKRAFVLDPSSRTLRSLGCVQLAAGNYAAFRDTCRKLFEKDGESKDLTARDGLAWLAVQSAATATDWNPYVTLARKACREKPDVGVYRETLGATLFRAELFSEAAPELKRAVAKQKKDGTWSMNLFLALVEANLDDTEKTKQHFRAAEVKFSAVDSPDWADRLRYRLLHDEATQLLAGRSPVKAERPQGKAR